MARGRGNTGTVIAVVIFAMLFVLSTVVAIIFYTEKEDMVATRKKAEADLLVYRTGSDHGDDSVKALRDMVSAGTAPSVVRVLLEDRDWLIKQIDSKRNTKSGASSTIDASLKSLGLQSNPGGLVNIIDDLKTDADGLRNKAAAAEAIVTSQKDKFKEYEAQINDLATKYAGEVDALKAQLAAISSDNKTAQTNAQQQFQAVEITTQESAAKAQTTIASLEKDIINKVNEIQDLKNIIEKLRTTRKSNIGPDPSLQPDGKILSSLPDSGIVTINLNRDDRLFLGLTFEVFDKKQGVATRDQFNDVRGKATIEVSNIKEFTTECRVVRKDRNTNIFEGDIIANVVYDKHRTYKFYVFGDFDINNDLQSTASEQRRIKSMIEQWGGEVTKEMSYDVDFLVLGKLPVVPAKIDETDPKQIEMKAALERKLAQYLELEGEARTFRIPILNQHRFLTLVGYYDRNEIASPFKIPDSQNSALIRDAADDTP